MHGDNGPLLITMKGTSGRGRDARHRDFGGAAGRLDRGAAAAAAARRDAAAPRQTDISGAWLFEVTTAAGSGTPTITFKQERRER